MIGYMLKWLQELLGISRMQRELAAMHEDVKFALMADYADENDTLWKFLQWSVEGKSADEMNRLLGHDPLFFSQNKRNPWVNKARIAAGGG